jgi:hypothetical protein
VKSPKTERNPFAFIIRYRYRRTTANMRPVKCYGVLENSLNIFRKALPY